VIFKSLVNIDIKANLKLLYNFLDNFTELEISSSFKKEGISKVYTDSVLVILLFNSLFLLIH